MTARCYSTEEVWYAVVGAVFIGAFIASGIIALVEWVMDQKAGAK
jgi:hypothetical protein